METEGFTLTPLRCKARKGHLHLATRFKKEIVDLFGKLGFQQFDAPHIELDKYNFEDLNMQAASWLADFANKREQSQSIQTIVERQICGVQMRGGLCCPVSAIVALSTSHSGLCADESAHRHCLLAREKRDSRRRDVLFHNSPLTVTPGFHFFLLLLLLSSSSSSAAPAAAAASTLFDSCFHRWISSLETN